jgi:hypothetical protein
LTARGKNDGAWDIRPGQTLAHFNSCAGFPFHFYASPFRVRGMLGEQMPITLFFASFPCFQTNETDMRPLVHSAVQSSDGRGAGGRNGCDAGGRNGRGVGRRGAAPRVEGLEARRGGREWRRERGGAVGGEEDEGERCDGRPQLRRAEAFGALPGEGGRGRARLWKRRRRRRLRGDVRLGRRAHAVAKRNERWVDVHAHVGLTGTGESVGSHSIQANVQ